MLLYLTDNAGKTNGSVVARIPGVFLLVQRNHLCLFLIGRNATYKRAIEELGNGYRETVARILMRLGCTP